MQTFSVKPHMSEVMVSVRVIDALMVPGVLFVLARAKGCSWDASLNVLGVLGMLLTALSLEAAGLYRIWRGARLRAEVHTLVLAWAFVIAGVLVLTSLIPAEFRHLPPELLFQWLVLTPGVIAGAHVACRALVNELRKRGYNQRTAVVAGAGVVGRELVRKLSSVSWAGIELVGFFDDDPEKQGKAPEGVPVLGTLDELAAFVRSHSVDLVYLSLPLRAEERMRELLDRINEHTLAGIYMVPNIFVFDLLGSRLHDLDGIPMVSLSESPQIGPAGVLKRFEDLLLATVGLVLLAPLFLLLALLVKRSSPGPVLFRHERIGQHGCKFKCYKFRTMVPDAAEFLARLLESDPAARAELEKDHKLRDDPRVTRIGKFLRRTSLDELPQLLNVLRGEMSLVGPRPIVEDEIRKYGRFFRHYSLVRPGLTGLWQVSGRNDVTYEERVQLDVQYVRSWSVLQDLSILWRTLGAVLAREGSY